MFIPSSPNPKIAKANAEGSGTRVVGVAVTRKLSTRPVPVTAVVPPLMEVVAASVIRKNTAGIFASDVIELRS